MPKEGGSVASHEITVETRLYGTEHRRWFWVCTCGAKGHIQNRPARAEELGQQHVERETTPCRCSA